MSRKRSPPRVLGPYADGARWRIISVDSAGNRESAFFETESKAERYREMLVAAMSTEEHTTETAFELYKQHLRDRKGNKASSITTTTYAIRRFFPEPLQLASLTPKRCQSLYDELCERPSKQTKKPPSADTHQASAKEASTFLAWCVRQRWIPSNPAESIELRGRLRPRGKSLGQSGAELRVREARVWFEKAVELANAGNEGAIASLIALLLGMRASEIVSRKVSDVDSDQADCDLLWIACGKTAAARRALEVPEVLQPILSRLVAGRPPEADLFVCMLRGAHHGKRRNRDWVRHQVHAVCDAAGVARVTAHAMRGLLATITAERGMAAHLISMHLGHESSAVTRRAYMAPGSEDAGTRRRGLTLLNGGLNTDVQVTAKAAK
jgi:integrase